MRAASTAPRTTPTAGPRLEPGLVCSAGRQPRSPALPPVVPPPARHRFGQSALLLAFLSACRPQPAPTKATADSAAPVEDSAVEPQPPAGTTVEAVPVVCADPGARETLGEFEPWARGEAWAAQRPLGLPPGEEPRPGAGALVEDLTGDGILDVFLTGEAACMLFEGQADGRLMDASARLLPAMSGGCRAWGLSAADPDADGDLDVLLARDGVKDLLLVNQGDGQLRAHPRPGLGERGCGSRSASWGDIDGDGDLDLFVARHHVVGPPVTPGSCPRAPAAADPSWSILPGDPNSLYLSNGDGTFTEVSERIGEVAQQGYTFLGAFLDLDEDGDQDLYLINDYGGRSVGNLALRNDGAGFFDDPGAPTAEAHLDPIAAEEAAFWQSLRVRGDTMSLGVGDLDGDERPDLAIADIDAIHLMLSAGGEGWYDAAVARDLRPSSLRGQRAAWGTEVADLDNDGLLDVVSVFGPTEGLLEAEGSTTTEQPDAAFYQRRDGGFVDRAPVLGLDHTGVGRGLVVADMDGDGWLDLLRTDYRGGPATLERQRCGEAAWLSLRLLGMPGNPGAIGAKVTARVDGLVHTRWSMASSTSLASAGPSALHFGLGDAALIEELRVRWPDGHVDVLRDVEPRQRLTLRRSNAP